MACHQPAALSFHNTGSDMTGPTLLVEVLSAHIQ